MAEEEKPGSIQTQSEPEGSIRPFPTPPRNPGTVRVFALVVGINDYRGQIPRLNGCLKDVDQVAGYLRKKFGDPGKAPATTVLNGAGNGHASGGSPIQVETDGRLQLCTLTDSQATYDNIVRGFREHLSNATDKDTVWFHFSGHGAEQFAAPEFKALDPNGKDQALVCYREENDTNSQLFLADKELAVLLHEVSKKRPHIVVSLDACHSGSGTRDLAEPEGLKPRTFLFLQSANQEDPALLPDVSAVRSFDSYLGGIYSKMDHLDIPVAEHVLLSACESVQTAGDLPQGGVFTSSLIQALDEAPGPIHYASLFAKTRARASKRRSAQNPQFDTIGGFDPYTSFLLGEPMGDINNYYEVFRQGGGWYVRCGAIHGLPAGRQEQIRLMISSDNLKDEDGNPLKVGAHIEKVGAQHSRIKLMEGESLAENGEYFAEVLAMPAPPLYVKLEGADKASLHALQEAWDASKNVLPAGPAGDTEPPALTLEATGSESFIIRDAQSGKLLVEVPAEAGGLARRIQLVRQNLDKIARWKRMIALDNPNTRIRNLFDFELLVTDKNRNTVAYREKEVTIEGTDGILHRTANGSGILGINFRVRLNQASQDLYFYAFDLSSGCAVKFRSDEEKVIRVANMNAGDTMQLRTAPYGWGLGPDDREATRWFKLLATTEELDYHQLEQAGLSGHRDAEEALFAPEKISEDWCAETIKVALVRQKTG